MDFNGWQKIVQQSGGNTKLPDPAWLHEQYSFGTSPADVARAIQAGYYRRPQKALIDGNLAIGIGVFVLILLGGLVLAIARQIGNDNRGRASIASLVGTYCTGRQVPANPPYHGFVVLSFDSGGSVEVWVGDDKSGRVSWSNLPGDETKKLQYDDYGVPYIYSQESNVRLEFERDPKNSNQLSSRILDDRGKFETVFVRTSRRPDSYEDYLNIRNAAEKSSQP